MTTPNGFPIHELPADPGRLSLVHRKVQPVLASAEYDAVEEWTVTVVAPQFRGRTTGGEVGMMTLYRLRRDNVSDCAPPTAAEGDDHWLAELSRFLLDWDGSPRARFADMVSSTDGDVLAVHNVCLAAEWHGTGVEAALLAEAIWALADGCCAVVTDSYTNACPDHPPTADTRWSPVPSTVLDGVWPSIGFRRLPSLHLLDTAHDEPRRLRKQARADLAALSHTYQTRTPRH
ncbi:hypothetical protein [Streptomyces sp. NPDC001828]|uniref:hypothetical protein n=1 Tax=Streptomyces sp. NPDC001828 TaxID=3364615 RepID=UPI0036D11F21